MQNTRATSVFLSLFLFFTHAYGFSLALFRPSVRLSIRLFVSDTLYLFLSFRG